MAGAVVGMVVDKLSALLAKEFDQFQGLHRDMQYIRDELDSISLVLEEADAKVETGDTLDRFWVKQLRELAFTIEDVIDEYTLDRAQRQDQGSGFFCRIGRPLKRLKERHQIASRVEEIKKSLVEVKARSERWRPTSYSGRTRISTATNQWHDPRVASLFVEEADLVGIDAPKDDLLHRLLDGVESKKVVISIVGMGGLGKTTLAKKVYDDLKVITHFDCHAWITVSQSFKADQLLWSMIRQLHHSKENAIAGIEGTETMGEVSMITYLRQYLANRRYIVVFDDVWKNDFWDYMKLALPDNKIGSRIIFTTRNEDAAPSFKESALYHVHKMESLTHEKAFELFCNKAFCYEQGHCPPTLMGLSHAIVERCGGLPLAIVTIGGLLATKDKIASEWKNLYDGLSSAIARDESLASDSRLASIRRVLSLSYHDLSYCLKTCFLYLGLFPEDFYIERSRLIRLWVAQGFIKEKQGLDIQVVGNEYLRELTQRSLVQVRYNISDKVKRFGVHDMMREAILSRSEEIGVLSLARYNMNAKVCCRHLSIYGQIESFPQGLKDSQIRSLIVQQVKQLPGTSLGIFFNYKLLSALDFEDAQVDHIPDEIGNLWHLRYLSLQNTNVQAVPKSLSKLCNLETLDLRNSPVIDLPFAINALSKLKFLLAYHDNYDDDFSPRSRQGIKIHGTIGCLKALQKLSFVKVNGGVDLINEVGRLTGLRKLGLQNLRTEDGSALCMVLERMTLLRSLKIHLSREVEFLSLQPVSSPPPLLRRLYLTGPLVTLPQWIPKLQHLLKISLKWSRLGSEALEVLGYLPNLVEIWFYKAYDGKQLHFPRGSFCKLKLLSLECLVGLETLVFEEGALPSIKELRLGPFPQLKELPSSIHYLRNLTTLEFFDLQKEHKVSVVSGGGCDYWKIEHIPVVLFHDKTVGMRYETYKLGDPDLVKCLNGTRDWKVMKQSTSQLHQPCG